MSKLRCAVIGVGYLGRFHAQKYAAIPEVELVGVFDQNSEQAQIVAREFGVHAFENLSTLVQHVDLVSIAASTPVHYVLAKFCLEQGLHVLLEKPMTLNLNEARELIECAKSNDVILQIGHLERFNPAYQAFMQHMQQPIWIEMQRLAPFKKRGSEVDVILDLMIHDLDILLSMVTSPIIDIKAKGLSMMTKDIDLASVAITFANSCVANLTASRVHSHPERLTRVYQEKDYYVLNFQEQQLSRYIADPYSSDQLFLTQEILSSEKKDALYEQIYAFIQAITDGEKVLVDGQAGMSCLDLALKIQGLIQLPMKENTLV